MRNRNSWEPFEKELQKGDMMQFFFIKLHHNSITEIEFFIRNIELLYGNERIYGKGYFKIIYHPKEDPKHNLYSYITIHFQRSVGLTVEVSSSVLYFSSRTYKNNWT